MGWKEDQRAAYLEKLKDPRWQQIRLRVFERDNWTCLVCGRKDRTLNVHHWFYRPKREPWEYELEALATLCEDCHGEETELWPEAQAMLIEALRFKRFDSSQVDDLAQTIMARLDGLDDSELIRALTYCAYHDELRARVVALYRAHFSGKPVE